MRILSLLNKVKSKKLRSLNRGNLEMSKIFILDTNVIIEDPFCINKFEDNQVVITSFVLDEVDTFKRDQGVNGYNARTFIKEIDYLCDKYGTKISEGIPLENGGEFRIEMNHTSFSTMEDVFSEDSKDNRILAVAVNLNSKPQAFKSI
jgi:PhoH-like ATPase